MIDVFLVEDEPPALRKLERMVAASSDLRVCGTASTCADAIAGITTTKPRLLILDVRLPDGTAFDVVQAIGDLPASITMFLTAYEDYAVSAFEIAAVDYLLKPVTQHRFAQAIERVRARLTAPPTSLAEKYTRRFLVERRNAAYLLLVEKIQWIEADRNYARVHSEMGEFTLRATMDSLEQRLNPKEFVRVSRSAIVRVADIREVREGFLVLTSGLQITFSKRYWNAALGRLL